MPQFRWTPTKHTLSLLYWVDFPKQGVVVVLQAALPSSLCSPVTVRSPLSSGLAGSLAACLLLSDSLCLEAACAACQSRGGICVPLATWRVCPGCLPPLARAQQPIVCRGGVISSGFPEPSLLKLVQTLLLLQPVRKASDKAAPAAAATLISAKAGGCWALRCGSCVLFQAALLPAPSPAAEAVTIHLFLPFISLCMVG